MMNYWTILDTAGEVLVPCVASEAAPDPAAYHEQGQSAEQLAGPLDTFIAKRVNGQWVEDLSQLESMLGAQIDAEAGEFRRSFITDVPGQDMTYLRKEALAREWTAEADQAKFALLTLEAEARGITMEQQVALVISVADQWAVIGDRIEVARMKAKIDLAAATTADAKRAASVVDWAALLT